MFIISYIRERCERSLDSEEKLEELPSFIPYNLLTQHSIPDKSIADCVEALIGKDELINRIDNLNEIRVWC